MHDFLGESLPAGLALPKRLPVSVIIYTVRFDIMIENRNLTIFQPLILLNKLKHIKERRAGQTKMVGAVLCEGYDGPCGG